MTKTNQQEWNRSWERALKAGWLKRWAREISHDGGRRRLKGESDAEVCLCTSMGASISWTCVRAHAHWTRVCVCVYTEKEQTDGKLTLSETSVIKIIDGLGNFPELQTNIGTKPSYLGSNNIHRWIQVANWCSAMLQGHDLENQNPAAVWKRVKGLGVARSSLICQWIQIHISKLASKSQLFEAF